MRLLPAAALLIIPAVLTAGPSHASSILTITDARQPTEDSVVSHRCDACAPMRAKPSRSTYKVPSLEPGTQRNEIVDIGGEKMLVRTEAWSGGSPVVFVSKAQSWLDRKSGVAEGQPGAVPAMEPSLVTKAPTPADGIDASATTSSLNGSAVSPPAATGERAPQMPDLSQLELRPTTGK